MKKVITSFVMVLLATVANAQYYGVGSSSSSTDSWGNTTTTYRDSYGNRTGSSTSSTDSWGNRNTQQRSNNPNSSIWTW